MRDDFNNNEIYDDGRCYLNELEYKEKDYGRSLLCTWCPFCLPEPPRRVQQMFPWTTIIVETEIWRLVFFCLFPVAHVSRNLFVTCQLGQLWSEEVMPTFIIHTKNGAQMVTYGRIMNMQMFSTKVSYISLLVGCHQFCRQLCLSLSEVKCCAHTNQ